MPAKVPSFSQYYSEMALRHCLIIIPTFSVSSPLVVLSTAGSSARCPPINQILYVAPADPVGNSKELFQGASQVQDSAENEKRALGDTAKPQLIRHHKVRGFCMVTTKLVTSKHFQAKSFCSLQAQVIRPVARIHEPQNSRELHVPTTSPRQGRPYPLSSNHRAFLYWDSSLPIQSPRFLLEQNECFSQGHMVTWSRTGSKTTSSDLVPFPHHIRMSLQIKK